MTTPLRSDRLRSILLAACAGTLSLLLASCSEGRAGTAAGDQGAGTPSAATAPAGDATLASAPLVDAPLADWQVALLEVARKSATAIPVAPHIKDRSKAQEGVVTACLALDQPQRALAAAGEIGNWRRGTSFADIATWAAEHGRKAEAERIVKLAEDVAAHEENGDSEESQGWRRDRVRAGIGRTYLLLGQPDKARAATAAIEDGEEAAVAPVKARLSAPEDFDAQLAELDAAVKAAGFDRIHDAMVACAQLFDRDYADVARRTRAEDAIKASWKKLPVAIGIELLERLTESALSHEDHVKALALADEAQQLIDGGTWLPQDSIPLQARIAALRNHAGDKEGARKLLDAQLALFDAEHVKIANIYRAAALRPVAEALQSMGDTTAARAVYRKAIEEGFVNPNSRPRAEDLSATCLSMAVHGVEPDAAMVAQIGHMSDALGAPW